MNKRDQQILILSDYKHDNRTMEQTLDALAVLDAPPPEKAFYAMLNQLDADRRLLLQAQGDPKETRAAIDRLVSHLMGYAEKMGEG